MTLRKKFLIFLSMAMLIAISVTNISYAGEEEDPITVFLQQYMEANVQDSKYEVSREGELAIFTIYSEGTGWTTWKDVACIKSAFGAASQDSVRDVINSIRNVIIDTKGDVIYETEHYYINFLPDDIPEECRMGGSLREALSTPDSADETASAEQEKTEFNDTVVVENNVTGEEIDSTLDAIKSESMTREADGSVSQSEVKVENEDGDVVAYYAADHENGVYFSWSAQP